LDVVKKVNEEMKWAVDNTYEPSVLGYFEE
jgi:hypothetical protein